MRVTYVCDICGQPHETVEVEDVKLENLGINTLTPAEREDIIKYNDEQGLFLHSICPSCFEKQFVEPPGERPGL